MKPERLIGKQIGVFSTMMALVLLFSGCQGQGGEETASVRLSLDLAGSQAKAAQAPAPRGITSVRVEVTGPEMAPVSTSVEVNSDAEPIVVLNIPAGPARRFVVTALDVEGTAQFRGEATVDLVPGSSPNVTISMVSLDTPVTPEPPPSVQISPHTAVVPKDTRPRFSVTGIDLSEVQFEVTSAVGNTPEQVGSVATDGDYTPPATILTDGATPIGNPIPITVTAIDKNDPTVRDSATVTLTTGSQLKFEKNVPVIPATTTFRPISTDSSGQRNIVYHQGKVYTVWSQFYNPRETNFVFFSQSANGTDWSSPISVTGQINQDTSVAETEPVVAVGPDGTVYVALTTNACPFCSVPSYRVQLFRLPVGAQGFTSLFGPFATNSSNSPSPSMAVSPNGNVFVAWTGQELRGNVDIFMQRLNKDGGLIDAAPRNLTKDIGAFTNTLPVLSIGENGVVYLVWRQGPNTPQLLAIASSDGGNTFSMPGAVTNASGFQIANPSVAAGPDGTVYITWDTSNCDCSSYEVFFDTGNFQDSTLIFGTEKAIGKAIPNSENQTTPSAAWDRSAGIYIGFIETLSGFGENGVFLAKSRDGGTTFTFSRVDDGSIIKLDKGNPSLAIDPAGRAFAVWTRFGFLPQGSEIDDILFAMGE